MNITVNFYAELVDYFGKSTEINLTDDKIKIGKIIEEILKRSGQNNKNHFTTPKGDIELVIIIDGNIKKPEEEIYGDTIIDILPVMVGG